MDKLKEIVTSCESTIPKSTYDELLHVIQTESSKKMVQVSIKYVVTRPRIQRIGNQTTFTIEPIIQNTIVYMTTREYENFDEKWTLHSYIQLPPAIIYNRIRIESNIKYISHTKFTSILT